MLGAIKYVKCVEQVIAPGAVRRYAPADDSSTRGGSTSVRGRVRSPHMAKLQAASVPYSLGQLRHGTDRQTDGRIAAGEHNNTVVVRKSRSG